VFDSANKKSLKSFLGIELFIKQRSYRFIIDSASSLNLVTKQVISETGLVTKPIESSTVGMGGSGSIFSSVCRVDEAQSATVGKSALRVLDLEFAVLDDKNTIPNSSDGILGIPFLMALPNSLVEFDFTANVMRAGMSSLPRISDANAARMCPIVLRRGAAGLRFCDARLDGNRVNVIALPDLGSSYTIINTAAAKELTGRSADELPLSDLIVAGVDGKPLQLRLSTIEDIALGKARFPGPYVVLVGDIPGFAAIGLGPHIPAALLGTDVLARTGKGRLASDLGTSGGAAPRIGKMGLDLRTDWMYLEN